MFRRFAILFTLLLFRVLFAPVWFSCNIQHVKNPAGLFEQVRLHKCRSSFTDDATAPEISYAEEQDEDSVDFRLLDVIKSIFLSIWNYPVKPFYHYSPSFSSLFIRFRVLRI